MSKFFVPYVGEAPAAVDIKGHRLLIVSTSSEDLVDGLAILGGDRLEEVEVSDDFSTALAELASRVNGGVVFSPPGTSVGSMLIDLERELPWVH